ncbi:MAG: PqqD family protein [Chloroflexi bacterium]|nr:PqqD family protein [Chloroflexota bacterium]MCI0787437.1 PqqD family protein [Chloroflexota bacterium]
MVIGAAPDLLTKPLPKESVHERLIDEELFLFDSEDSNCTVHTLNGGAALIWYLCDGARDIQSIAREIATGFDLKEREVLPDVQAAVARFHELSLLET